MCSMHIARSENRSASTPSSPDHSCAARTCGTGCRMRRGEPDSAFFATYLPIYLDYLAVEKGLAKNSLAAYGTDLRRFGKWLDAQSIETESAKRQQIVRYIQSLRSSG